MTTKYQLNMRVFHVLVRDRRTGEEQKDRIVFSKDQLKLAESLGMTAEDLIHRRYNERGYFVLQVSKAIKHTVDLDLEALYLGLTVSGKREQAGACIK